jgi:hypothetical protein
MVANILNMVPISLGTAGSIGRVICPISHEHAVKVVALDLVVTESDTSFFSKAAAILESTPPDIAT